MPSTEMEASCFLTVLDEANLLGIAAEALPATHEPILPDQTMWVPTNTAGT